MPLKWLTMADPLPQIFTAPENRSHLQWVQSSGQCSRRSLHRPAEMNKRTLGDGELFPSMGPAGSGHLFPYLLIITKWHWPRPVWLWRTVLCRQQRMQAQIKETHRTAMAHAGTSFLRGLWARVGRHKPRSFSSWFALMVKTQLFTALRELFPYSKKDESSLKSL